MNATIRERIARILEELEQISTEEYVGGTQMNNKSIADYRQLARGIGYSAAEVAINELCDALEQMQVERDRLAAAGQQMLNSLIDIDRARENMRRAIGV